MASFAGFTFSLLDIIAFSTVVLFAFIYIYNKSLKAVDVWARIFYDNNTSEDIRAKEFFNERRLEIDKNKGGGIFGGNKKDNKESISYDLAGLPSEHRLGATKRARVYYVREGGTKTLDFMEIDTGTGDPVNRIIQQTSAKVRSAQEAMHQSDRAGLKNMIPGFIMGLGVAFMILYILKVAFPEIAF